MLTVTYIRLSIIVLFRIDLIIAPLPPPPPPPPPPPFQSGYGLFTQEKKKGIASYRHIIFFDVITLNLQAVSALGGETGLYIFVSTRAGSYTLLIWTDPAITVAHPNRCVANRCLEPKIPWIPSRPERMSAGTVSYRCCVCKGEVIAGKAMPLLPTLSHGS